MRMRAFVVALVVALLIGCASEDGEQASVPIEPPVVEDPQLAFEDPELAGLCEDVINDFGEGEPAPAATEDEATALFVTENRILEGLDLVDGAILLGGERVGSYQVVPRPGGTFAVESGTWCFSGG